MDFNNFNWNETTDIWEKWWNGELGRPIFNVSVTPAEIKASSSLPLHHFMSFYDFSVDPKDILKRHEDTLHGCKYYDAGFPRSWINFGPGVLAAFCGGEGINGESTVWFEPGKFARRNIKDVQIKLDKTSPWFKRVESFFTAAVDLWHGKVNVGMTDLGGNLDVLSSFMPGEQLLLDLYDQPEEVDRLLWEAHDAWWEAFNHFNGILGPVNPGCSNWAGMLSKESHYMLQCDFAYMISPDMFGRFVMPELTATCRRLKRGFYHLDGKGQLPHLDQLLAMPEMVGIQWVPGSGAMPIDQWPEVFKKICDAGKKVWLSCNLDNVEKIFDQGGKPELFMVIVQTLPGREGDLIKLMKKYGAI